MSEHRSRACQLVRECFGGGPLPRTRGINRITSLFRRNRELDDALSAFADFMVDIWGQCPQGYDLPCQTPLEGGDCRCDSLLDEMCETDINSPRYAELSNQLEEQMQKCWRSWAIEGGKK